MEKRETIISVTFILSGSLLQMFNGIGNGWISTLTAIFGLILFFMGLNKLKNGVDEKGRAAVKILIISAIVGIIGLVLDLIPLVGIVASIVFIAAFIIQLIGIIKLKNSESIGKSGKSGVILLLVAMILAIAQSIFGFVPLAGGIIAGIISFAALILVFFGWLKVQDGIIIHNT